MQSETAFAREAMQKGARAYVLKEAADRARQGGSDGRGRRDLSAARARARSSPPSRRRPDDDLSERELEVLRLIALGHTNNEIAEQLYLSVRTVESHRAHIQQKLRRSTRSELVRYALERGLLEAA